MTITWVGDSCKKVDRLIELIIPEMSENIGVITGRLLSEYPEALRLPEHYASKDAPIFIDGKWTFFIRLSRLIT